MEPANAESIALELEREHALDRVESTELERDEQLDRIENAVTQLREDIAQIKVSVGRLEEAALALQGAVEQAQAHPMLGQFLGNGGDGH